MMDTQYELLKKITMALYWCINHDLFCCLCIIYSKYTNKSPSNTSSRGRGARGGGGGLGEGLEEGLREGLGEGLGEWLGEGLGWGAGRGG